MTCWAPGGQCNGKCQTLGCMPVAPAEHVRDELRRYEDNPKKLEEDTQRILDWFHLKGLDVRKYVLLERFEGGAVRLSWEPKEGKPLNSQPS